MSSAALATWRPPFLVLAPLCVLVGGLAVPVSPWRLELALALLAALAAHAAVNGFNELADFASGLDMATERTPFSGGSGTLPADPQLVPVARALAWLALAVTLLAGLALVALRGPWLLLPGLIGLALVTGYSQWLVRRPLLCLLAPGVAFGPLMVAGSAYAVGGSLDALACWLSVPLACTASNLLLLNQLPDRVADAAHGRRSLPVVHGVGAALAVYRLLAWAGMLATLVGVMLGALPVTAVLALLPQALALRAARCAARAGPQPAALLPCLRLNAMVALATPASLALALVLAGLLPV